MKVYFDGGARPNPGMIETAVVAGAKAYLRGDHGMGDSSDAEWLALIEALRVARDLGLRDVLLLGDSRMVVEQARRGDVARRFHPALARYQTLAAGFDRVRVRHVGRKQNLAGIALERARENDRAKPCRV